jgi:hypothetical protein
MVGEVFLSVFRIIRGGTIGDEVGESVTGGESGEAWKNEGEVGGGYFWAVKF